MPRKKPTTRSWVVDLSPDEVRMRCSFRRRGKHIMRYTVQLEILDSGAWKPVVRYDNAHGFCHRDTIHPDGTQDKMALFKGNANETFTWAIDDLHANWEAHRGRFLGEIDS